MCEDPNNSPQTIEQETANNNNRNRFKQCSILLIGFAAFSLFPSTGFAKHNRKILSEEDRKDL